MCTAFRRDGKRVRGRQRQGVGGAGGRAEQDMSTCARALAHTHALTHPLRAAAPPGCEPGGDPAGLRWARGRGRVPAFHAPSGGAGSPAAPEAPGRLVTGRHAGRGFWCPTVTARATPSSGGSGEMAAAMVGANGGFWTPRAGGGAEFSASGPQEPRVPVSRRRPRASAWLQRVPLQPTSWAPLRGGGGRHRHTPSFLLRQTHLGVSPGPWGRGFGHTRSHEERPAHAGAATAGDSQQTGRRF